MLVFHEGLPGAGKSYEACVYHILPALEQGRAVITNIEGINHQKFSDLTGIPVAIVRKLLTCVYHPEIADIEQRHTEQLNSFLQSQNDSLLVIDEIQNLHPSGRQKLSPEWSKFITEHRHNGLDIILMGQDKRDCHALWRRRIQRLIVFTKQTALGRDGHYLWRAYEATTAENYREISSGSRSYEKKYFGLYASHTNDTQNKNVYSDKRINVFKTGLFTTVLPLVLLASGFGLWYLVKVFTDPTAITGNTSGQQVAPPTVREPPPPVAPVIINRENLQATTPSTSADKQTQPAQKPPPIDVFDEMAQKYRARLSAVVVGESGRLHVQIDMLDPTFHVQDSYTSEALTAMGWQLSYNSAGLTVTKSGKTMLIRPWPIEPFGKTDSYRASQL